MPSGPPVPPLPPGARAPRYEESSQASPTHSRDQSPARDPFVASHEDIHGTGNYAMSSLNAPSGTGSNYGTAPNSPYHTVGGSVAGGSYNQSAYRGSQGYAPSGVQLSDFGPVEHGRYPHSEEEEHQPLNEGAGFTGGFYPPPGAGGGSV